MSTLISIIIPCYNQAQYLDETLQSVIGANVFNWECIIVNDGSPDETEIITKWAVKILGLNT
jgi:glycosyltransferase involved in cell wall biosynthesis